MTPASGQNRVPAHQFYQKKQSPRPHEAMPKLELDDNLVDNKSLSPIKGDNMNGHQRNVHGSQTYNDPGNVDIRSTMGGPSIGASLIDQEAVSLN